MHYVYAIRSLKDGRIYVGMSSDVKRRLEWHNKGMTRSTKGFVPWEPIFVKEVSDRLEARKWEKYYKSGVGKEYLKALNLENGPVVQRIPACRQAGNRSLSAEMGEVL